MHIKKGKFDSSFSKYISACRHIIFIALLDSTLYKFLS